eukprot:14013909-Ditylum_brightwellii.AAC.1
MALAAEAELGVLFENAKEAVTLHSMLTELGHQQPATPVQVDNSTAQGIVNSNVRQHRVKQGQFKIYWELGRNNKADYFTKHHPPAHHRK